MSLDNEKRAQLIVIARNHGQMTFKTIAAQHGLTGTRVQQIYKKAMRARQPRTPADELTARVRNALGMDGCAVTPEAVSARYNSAWHNIKRVPNIGALSLRQINEWLMRHGQKEIK